MDRLAFDLLELKFAGDDTTGTIDGYASVFGLVDRAADKVLPGAFTKTLADWRARGGLPPMLWQHDPASPIGVWTDLVEDHKGLKVSGRLALEISLAANARALANIGAVKGLSIGYEAVEWEIDRETGVRLLKQVDLWEISLVTFPCLPEAQISSVKSFDPRALEAQLRRECNLSSAAAVKAVAIVKQHLRDGGAQPETDPRDGEKAALMSLRRAIAAFSA